MRTRCLDCPRIIHRGSRCPDCERKRNRRRGTASQRGYDWEWQKLRRAILMRDPTCQAEGCDDPSQEVDHIIPKYKGGTDAPENLQGLCRYHNRSKSWQDRRAG